MNENDNDIKLCRLESGLLWPFSGSKKAWSANTLTKFIKELEYGSIPDYILQAAAERGKVFHQVVQDYLQSGNYPSFVDQSKLLNLSQLDSRIYETINFLKGDQTFQSSSFLGSEQLHYTFYKGELIATYTDVVYQHCVVELKTSNIKANNSSLILLSFEIQLLIQHLCTGKNVFLLWSTGKGIIFNKFKASDELLKILEMLIDLAYNQEVYSINCKKLIANKIIDLYRPRQLMLLAKDQ